MNYIEERIRQEGCVKSGEVLKVDAFLNHQIDMALIDGNRDKGKSFTIKEPHRLLVKGDSKSASIAAASILAKVSRDRFMLEQAKLYPQYQFEKHKGYGTKLHCDLLKEHGPSPIHRPSFLGKILGGER